MTKQEKSGQSKGFMILLLLSLGVITAIVIISFVSNQGNTKTKGILGLLASKTNNEIVANPQEYVEDWLNESVYSFLYVEADCPSKGLSGDACFSGGFFNDFKTKSYKDFNHAFKSSCDIGEEFPDYLNNKGCWIFAIERDPAWDFKDGDDCANNIIKELLSEELSNYDLDPKDSNHIMYKNCVSLGRKDTCSKSALSVIREFMTYTYNTQTIKPSSVWLCGKQKPGPKVWFYCNSTLAKYAKNPYNRNLTLFEGLGETPVSYKCDCDNTNNCAWTKISK